MHHLNNRTRKTCKTISRNAKKTFDRIKHPLTIIKDYLLPKCGLEELHLKIVQTIYNKPILDRKCSGETLKAFPLKSGARQGCPLFPLLFNKILEVLVTVTVHKIYLNYSNWRRNRNISLFAKDMILNKESSKDK